MLLHSFHFNKLDFYWTLLLCKNKKHNPKQSTNIYLLRMKSIEEKELIYRLLKTGFEHYSKRVIDADTLVKSSIKTDFIIDKHLLIKTDVLLITNNISESEFPAYLTKQLFTLSFSRAFKN